MDTVVFIVGMGIGKNIMGTVPLRGIRKKYPKHHIVVVGSHAEVFRNNPNCDMVYTAGNTPNFWELYSGALVLKSEPYYDSQYLDKKRHLTEAWCEQLDVPFDNSTPDIFLNPKEEARGLEFVRKQNKPILLIQFQGGVAPQQDPQNEALFHCPKMFIRNLDMEVAKEVSHSFKDTYASVVVQYPTQQAWGDAVILNTGLRDIFAVIKNANKILCIDSFVMHCATAFGKKPVVCWAGTSVTGLGYKQNINLTMNECDTPQCGRPNSFLLDVDFKNQPWDCPLGEPCTKHDEQDVIDAITGAKNNEKKTDTKSKPAKPVVLK